MTPGNLTVSLSPLLTTQHGHQHDSKGKELSLTFVGASNHTSAKFQALPMRHGYHILYESYNAENFGHMLGDELWPLYRLAEIFHVADRLDDTLQLVRWVDFEPNNPACTTKSDRQRCAANYRRLVPLLSARPLQVLHPKRNTSSFCVSDLLVGVGALSDHCEDPTGHGRLDHKPARCNDGVAETVWRFRAHLLKRLMGTTTKDISNNNVTAPIVVLVRRGHRNAHRLPANYEAAMREVGTLLRREVAFVEMANRSLVDQARVLSRAKVLVSPAGGTSFVGLFLPRGAAMLLFSNARHDRHLDFGFYHAWAHVEVSYMLVTRTTQVPVAALLHRVARVLGNADAYGGGR